MEFGKYVCMCVCKGQAMYVTEWCVNERQSVCKDVSQDGTDLFKVVLQPHSATFSAMAVKNTKKTLVFSTVELIDNYVGVFHKAAVASIPIS